MSKTSFSLEEVAMLADGAGVPDQTAAKLATLMRTCPIFAKDMAELDAMAKAAGGAPLRRALAADRDFGQLLEAQWEHPKEVLIEAEHYDDLIAMAATRVDAAAGAEKERLREILKKLRSAQSKEEPFCPRFAGGLLAID